MDIVVLAGGISTERDVSITSGSMVAKALRKRGHRVVLLDVKVIGEHAALCDAACSVVGRTVVATQQLVEPHGVELLVSGLDGRNDVQYRRFHGW